MRIIDLTDKYISSVLENSDIKGYEKSFPDFFEYYLKFWAYGHNDYPKYEIGDLRKNRDAVVEKIKLVEVEYDRNGVDLSKENILLVVGRGYADGHTFIHEGEYWTWLAVETFDTESHMVTAIPHEIAHTLHYRQNPELFFHSIKEKELLSRQIICEGVATLISKAIMSLTDQESLWSDSMTNEGYSKWVSSIDDRKSETASYLEENWNSSAGSLFYANDELDVLKYRAGYKLAIDHVRGKLGTDASIEDLLNFSG